MDVLAVIVNYRTADLTLRSVHAALEALERFPGSRVSLVENGSGDGSAERFREASAREGWGNRVTLVESPENRGFAGGVNLAVRPVLGSGISPRYVYLLNSDARPEPDAIAVLVRFLDAHAEAGIAGSFIYGTDGVTHDTAFRFPSVASQLEEALGIGVVTRLLDRWVVSKPVPPEATRVDWLAGASMLIRREVFERVGLLDEGYFIYFEETDFCRSAARMGHAAWYVPESRVEHVGGASTGWKDFTKPRPSYWFDGRRRYFAKNHGRAYLWAANVAWLLGWLVGEPRRRLLGRRGPFPVRFVRDFLRHSVAPRRLGRERPTRA